jgi:Kdo2-lipid IVA lauroyltransferase/acyltransferase
MGFGLNSLSLVARNLPLPVARSIGAFLGFLGWHLLRRYRGRALANIAVAFPDWPPQRHRETIRQMFDNLGKSLVELAWLPALDREVLDRTTEIHDAHNIDRALAAGRGALIFTAHYGNWEWLAATVALLGYPLTVLQRERDEPDLNVFVTRIRSRFGMRTIGRKSSSSALEMFRTLRSGSLLAFLIDQNIRAESVKVPFFGKPALTPIGPARLAVRAEAPVMICFLERRGEKLVVHFQEPIAVTRNSDPVEITARLTAAIEEQIRRAPEQWVWFHNRWKERPRWEISALPVSAAAARSSK